MSFSKKGLLHRLTSTSTWVGLALLLCAYFLFDWSRADECPFPEFVLNSATELMGIGITVFIVQSIFEAVQKKADIKSVTWDILFDADYIIWVWQGGERVFNMKELMFLVNSISPGDPLPSTTANLIQALGNKAANLIKTKHELVDKNPKLRKGLEELSKLARVRDQYPLTPNTDIARIFKTAIPLFDKILDAKPEGLPNPELKKDPIEESQIWRHTGENLAPFNNEKVSLEEIKRRIEVEKGIN